MAYQRRKYNQNTLRFFLHRTRVVAYMYTSFEMQTYRRAGDNAETNTTV